MCETTEMLALLERDPAAGILAVAILREQRASSMRGMRAEPFLEGPKHTREHIAAEANPAHALAAVRRWRGVVKRHQRYISEPRLCANGCPGRYPCEDIAETADEARAYLGGAA